MIDAAAAKSNPDRYVIVPAALLASHRSAGKGSPTATASTSEPDAPLSSSPPPQAANMSTTGTQVAMMARARMLPPGVRAGEPTSPYFAGMRASGARAAPGQ